MLPYLRLTLTCCIWFVLAKPSSVQATTIDPLLFEELVLGADFVGIVECEKAGGIVAEYKIIESWKGPKAGGRVSIRIATDYWGDHYPLALCGERYFVTVYKVPPSTLMSTTSGAGVPLWWRNIPAEYRSPLWQGWQRINAGDEKMPEFQKQIERTQALLALKPVDQETALLKAVIEANLWGAKWRGGEPDKAKLKELKERMVKFSTAGDIVSELLRMTQEDNKKWGVRVKIVLEKAGSAATLAELQKFPADQMLWGKGELEGLINLAKRRCGQVTAESKIEKPESEKPEPTENELHKQRKIFAEGTRTDGFGEAFDILLRYDPAPVAEYLVAWDNPNDDRRDENRGYALGSYFGWRCGKDRTKHLTALLKAKDPNIQVAAAVYLCFEDDKAGVAELKKFTRLKGHPGDWAALTLARRGEKDAVLRMLEVFRELPPDEKKKQFGMAGIARKNVQLRVRELVSNSAKTSNLEPLSIPDEEAKQFDYLLKWWKENGNKITLQDPWMTLLEKQKID